MNDEWRVPGFTEVKVLGEGAQGRAVLVREETTGRVAVLKYASAVSERAQRAFRDESMLLKNVRSPYVAQWFGHYEHELGAAILMEAVDGVSLRALLDERGPLPPDSALVILKGSLLGLAAVHEAGVVHRDYKPANVVVRADGLSKLIDFGVATLCGQATRNGTPAYMAPEQWRVAPAGPAADVYSATCVFFECVTGDKPYRADTMPMLMNQHLTAPPPVERVPGSLRPLVEHGLAKDPADRPPSAAEFVTALEAVATARYGPDWEQDGVRKLAAAAVALAAAFPLVALALPGAAGGAAGGAAAGAGAASGGGAAGAASGAAGGGAAAGSGAGAASGAAGSGVASGGGAGFLGTVGGKVAVAVAGTCVVGAAAGGVVLATGDEPADPPAVQLVGARTAQLDQAYPLSGGRPDFQVQGAQYLQVTLRDKAAEAKANRALRDPVDRMVAASRQALQEDTSYGRSGPGCRGAGLRSTAVRGLSGPRLVSVRYDLWMGLVCNSEPFGGAWSVTVDLRTGDPVGVSGMFTPAGLNSLSDRLPSRPADDQGLCETLPERITAAELRPRGENTAAPVSVTPRPGGFEIGPGGGFPCEGHLVTVPYDRVRDLMRPDFAALLPAAPAPGRS